MEVKGRGDFSNFMNLLPVAMCKAGIFPARLRGAIPLHIPGELGVCGG